MLVAELDHDGHLIVISDEQVIARLGKGVDAHRIILPDTFERCENFLREYVTKAQLRNVDNIIATGTSALRDAKNREDFLAYIHNAVGLDIEIMSGDDEAIWTYRGAISGITKRNSSCAVLDIGGGSTELIVGMDEKIISRKSIDVGSVRVTEKFLLHSPPRDMEIFAAEEFISEKIESFPTFDPRVTTCIGVAGTVTTLAAIELGLEVFDRQKVAGCVLKKNHITHSYEQLRIMTVDQIRKHAAIDAGRADIIFAGLIILKMVLKKMEVEEIVVSERGLRYGIAMREFERIFQRNSRN